MLSSRDCSHSNKENKERLGFLTPSLSGGKGPRALVLGIGRQSLPIKKRLCRLVGDEASRLFPYSFLSRFLFPPPLRLASPFTDHMVLQRNQAVPIWGWTDPGDAVEVRFGDQVKQAKAGSDGRWQIDLEPLSASLKPELLTVKDTGGEEVVLKDVLVGEVWICSGQSNMKFETQKVPELKALLPKARNIRSFLVENTVSFTEEDFCKGRMESRTASECGGVWLCLLLGAVREDAHWYYPNLLGEFVHRGLDAARHDQDGAAF